MTTHQQATESPVVPPVPRQAQAGLRLSILLGLLLLLMTVTSLLALSQLRSVAALMDTVYKDRLLPMQQLRLVGSGFAINLNVVAERMAEGRLAPPQAEMEVIAIGQQVLSNWSDYRAPYLVEREKGLIASAEPQLKHGLELARRLPRIDPADRQAFMDTELRPAIAAISATMDELIQVQLDVGRRADEASQAVLAQAAWLVAALLLVMAVLAFSLGMSVLRLQRDERNRLEVQRERSQRYYRSLSLTNQLVLRATGSAQTLYEGVCKLCVETQLAKAAGVVLLADSEADHTRLFALAASAGPFESLLPGLPQRWRADAPSAIASLCNEALRSNAPALFNHLSSDRRLARWRASVIPPGLEAMAAFPLRRDGRVVGVIVLLEGRPEPFDAELVQLLSAMSENLAFGLDCLDRERARLEANARADSERGLFRRLFDTSAVACALSTLDEDRILEVNEALCQRIGYARADLLGRSLSDLEIGLGRADRARFRAQLEADGLVRNFETDIYTRHRGLRHVLLNGDLIDYQGQTCVLTSSVDVTLVHAPLPERPTTPPTKPALPHSR